MKMKFPYLIDNSDLVLWAYQQTFMASTVWFQNKMDNQIATFDLFIRDMPVKRNFLIAGGLEEFIHYLLNLTFKDDKINFLLKHKIINKKLVPYLRKFKFTGEIWAMPEGTIFFPQEPIIRVTAPIIEANMFSEILINFVTTHTLLLSKIIRTIIAVQPASISGIGCTRAHGFSNALNSQRDAYLVGAGNFGPLILAGNKFQHRPGGINIGYHAYIKSFSSEKAAMEALFNIYPQNTSLMVDTYDFRQGVENAIAEIKKIKNYNKQSLQITIDSGDLSKRSFQVRKMLDKAGLKNVKIVVASNLDEYRIWKLIKEKKSPVDKCIVGTDVVTSPDAPTLETVYKLSELKIGNKVLPKMKFSSKKMSLPGKKQVFRIIKNGFYQKDIIGLSEENLGHPLLKPIIIEGHLVKNLPTISHIRQYISNQLKHLPIRYLSIHQEYKYPVQLSQKLKSLIQKLKNN